MILHPALGGSDQAAAAVVVTGPARADIAVREPRCRICSEEPLRLVVNDLLQWRGVPIGVGRGRSHVVTYADVLRALNQDRGRPPITYSSLWVHAKRHYEVAGVAAYWSRRMDRQLRKALGG